MWKTLGSLKGREKEEEENGNCEYRKIVKRDKFQNRSEVSELEVGTVGKELSD
jgi:hypothetical protein